jgi:hypothetical protein
MSFINWSDPLEMLGLLAEYVADESLGERTDCSRADFLEELSSTLASLAAASEESTTEETIARLREIYDSHAPEFEADPALVHLDDCIQELERIVTEGGATQA